MSGSAASGANAGLPSHTHVVIIGGGPAGMGILIRAARLRRLRDLLKLGAVVLEADDEESLGCGGLRNYTIRSNTSASEFLKHLRPFKEAKETANSVKRPKSPEPKSCCKKVLTKDNILPMFASLRSTKPVIDLEAYGNECAPLKLIAQVLNSMGRVLLLQMQRKDYAKSACMCQARASSVACDLNGVRIEGARAGDPFAICTQYVVLAMGGEQRMLAAPAVRPERVLSGTLALSFDGVRQLRTRITPNCSVAIVGGSHSAWACAWVLLNKVCDSPEQAARLKRLLRREQMFRTSWPGHMEPESPHQIESFVARVRKQLDEESSHVPQWKRSTAASRASWEQRARKTNNQPGAPPAVVTGSNFGRFPKVLSFRASYPTGLIVRSGVEIGSSVVRTIGDGSTFEAWERRTTPSGIPRLFLGDGWVTEKSKGTTCALIMTQNDIATAHESSITAQLGEGSVTMVHRSRLREYYSSESKAKKANYLLETGELSRSGRVNPFRGVRWDACAVCRAVREGIEKRVKTVNSVVNPAEADRVLQSADIVINCTGFESRALNLPISMPGMQDGEGTSKTVQLLQDAQGALKLSKGVRVQAADGRPVPRVLGVGLGCGRVCNTGGLDGERLCADSDERLPRADGVDLYVNVYAKLVLDEVMNGSESHELPPLTTSPVRSDSPLSSPPMTSPVQSDSAMSSPLMTSPVQSDSPPSSPTTRTNALSIDCLPHSQTDSIQASSTIVSVASSGSEAEDVEEWTDSNSNCSNSETGSQELDQLETYLKVSVGHPLASPVAPTVEVSKHDNELFCSSPLLSPIATLSTTTIKFDSPQ